MDAKLGFAPSNDKLNVIVEGITDHLYLENMAHVLADDLEGICIIPSTGAQNVKHLCSILMGWGFRFLALFDFDGEGRRCANELIKEMNLEVGTSITFLKEISMSEFAEVDNIKSEDAVMIEGLISDVDRKTFDIDMHAKKDEKKIAALKFANGIVHDGYAVSEETKNSFRELFSRIKLFK